jgi:hypothetical protein
VTVAITIHIAARAADLVDHRTARRAGTVVERI